MSHETCLKVCFSQRNSYSLLQTSYALYSSLCQGRGRSAELSDYILYFGSRDHEIEAACSGRSRSRGPRSCEGRYEIRFVERNLLENVSPSSQWSLRQCAIYYHSVATQKERTWVFVTVPDLGKRRTDRYFAESTLGQDENALEVILLVDDTVMGHWIPSLVAMSSQTESHATQLLGLLLTTKAPLVQQTPLKDKERCYWMLEREIFWLV